MRFRPFVLALAVLLWVPAVQSYSQNFGVCSRAANDAAMLVTAETQRKIQLVLRYNYPPHVIQAHLDIIHYSQQEALWTIQYSYDECARGFQGPQQIVDIALAVFTRGLSRALPPGMGRIDMSEVLTGRPLGGPDAAIPLAREQILGGDTGTGANIVRDPIRCLTFQRKC